LTETCAIAFNNNHAGFEISTFSFENDSSIKYGIILTFVRISFRLGSNNLQIKIKNIPIISQLDKNINVSVISLLFFRDNNCVAAFIASESYKFIYFK
jgi:hypothetical protein